MFLRLFIVALIALSYTTSSLASYYNPKTNKEVQAFIQQLNKEQGLNINQLNKVFSQTKKRDDIIKLISTPAEKVLAWHEYRKIFITSKRIQEGKDFMRQYKTALNKAEKELGVPAEIITAIIGVETFYGRNKGKHRVIDALATLSFDYPPRQKFFRQELAKFLVLTHQAEIDPLLPMGSYAGAMGYPQFMPSSYLNFAIDFNDDGLADIWTNPTDAIGSVANYFKAHGWKTGEAILEEVASVKPKAKLPDLRKNRFKLLPLAEIKQAGMQPKNTQLNNQLKALPMAFATSETTEAYYLGLQNFYVITRYNHSRMYALAVHELAQAIKP